MSPFEIGLASVFVKVAGSLALPVSPPYLPQPEGPQGWDECVEEAAKQVFGIEDPQPTSGYGVNTSKQGTKQQLSYAVDNLEKKWSTHGKKPTSVGSGTRESPRPNVLTGSTLKKLSEALDAAVEQQKPKSPEAGSTDDEGYTYHTFNGTAPSKMHGYNVEYVWPKGRTDRNLREGDVYGVRPKVKAKPAPVAAAKKPATGQAVVKPGPFDAFKNRAVRKGESLKTVAGELGATLDSVAKAYGAKYSPKYGWYTNPGALPDVSKLVAYKPKSYVADFSGLSDADKKRVAATVAYEDPINYETILGVLQNRVQGDGSKVIAELDSTRPDGSHAWNTTDKWTGDVDALLGGDPARLKAYNAVLASMADPGRTNPTTDTHFYHASAPRTDTKQGKWPVGEDTVLDSVAGKKYYGHHYRLDLQ